MLMAIPFHWMAITGSDRCATSLSCAREAGKMAPVHNQKIHMAAFVCLFLLTGLPIVSASMALVAGIMFSLLIGNPSPDQASRASRQLLKLSVIGLGFGINFSEVIAVGKDSLILTLASIAVIIGLGELLGRAMHVPSNTRMLVSFGTAICGGSAIAALAPVIKAKDREIAVSLATVFTLNAVALILFPPLGRLFDLSQQQFGLWAALAIHDTSSVVGASASYGAAALAIGTTVKLTRALWIAPCALVAGRLLKNEQKTGIPLFILGFLAAAFINSWLPSYGHVWQGLHEIARQALVMTLFLIGAGLTRDVLAQVGLRPLMLGVLLWFLVSATALGLTMTNLIS